MAIAQPSYQLRLINRDSQWHVACKPPGKTGCRPVHYKLCFQESACWSSAMILWQFFRTCHYVCQTLFPRVLPRVLFLRFRLYRLAPFPVVVASPDEDGYRKCRNTNNLTTYLTITSLLFSDSFRANSSVSRLLHYVSARGRAVERRRRPGTQVPDHLKPSYKCPYNCPYSCS